MFYFMNFVHSFVNYGIFRELCDRMRFEVNCAKSHHHVISEGLNNEFSSTHLYTCVERGTVRVKCLAQEHNTMSLATRSGVEGTNHEATMLLL